MGYKNVLPILIVVSLLVVFMVSPLVTADDATLIPENNEQVEEWFKTNVAPVAQRKGTLHRSLEIAEASPRVITVDKKGSGDFKTIKGALDSIDGKNRKRVIIKVGPGEYVEKITIPRHKHFVTLIGQADDMPVISFDGTAAKYGTVDSATLIIYADYFMAVNIIVKNSAPMPDGKRKGSQALSMRISGNKAAFYNCKFFGFQDTLCDDRGHHFFKDCYIQGTFDFIFGSGTSLYLGTQLNVVGEGIRVITAHAGKSEEDTSGYSFVHCNVTGTGHGVYLGRAWMTHPKVVYAYTKMTQVVNPAGWQENEHAKRDKTVFYGEYKCTGAGARQGKRVDFTQEIDSNEAKRFLSLGYIRGSKWLLPPPSF